MDRSEAEHWANEAARLMGDNTFNTALDHIRQDAIDALIRVDATNIHNVVRLQAKITVIDDLRGELGQMIEQFASKTRQPLVL